MAKIILARILLQAFGDMHSPDAPSMSRVTFCCGETGLCALQSLLTPYGVRIDDEIRYPSEGAFAHCSRAANSRSLVPIKEIDLLLHEVVKTLPVVIERYAAAYKGQTPIERSPNDRRVLAFNRAAYAFSKRGGYYVFLPGTALEFRYVPLDPRMLNCPEPAEPKTIHLEKVIVLGARDADGRQIRLPFQGGKLTDVLVTVAHPLGEIMLTTTLAAGQDIWKKVTRITCDVVVEKGKIPHVKGEPVLERSDS
jgi:hypothetical protein